MFDLCSMLSIIICCPNIRFPPPSSDVIGLVTFVTRLVLAVIVVLVIKYRYVKVVSSVSSLLLDSSPPSSDVIDSDVRHMFIG